MSHVAIEPHGGKLINRISKNVDIKDLFQLQINRELANDVENIADGVFSPLEGFMCKHDFESVIQHGALENGLSWTIPIIMDVDETTAKQIQKSDVLLKTPYNNIAVLHVDEVYTYDKKQIMDKIYLTNDMHHPGVQKTSFLKKFLVGGKIDYLERPSDTNRAHRKTPIETRAQFKKLGWNSIVAFQTRNPPHVAHEMMQKTALVNHDGLFINPLIGKKKTGDFKDDIIIKSYETLIDLYYSNNTCELATLHTDMKYAGPKEAIHHAIMRQNYGCTHIIIGRDHAGVGNYYKPFAAQQIFDYYQDLKIKPIFFPAFFYCTLCLSFTNSNVCPHDVRNHNQVSGTNLRQMITQKIIPSKYIMRPEISKIIIDHKDPFVD